MDALHGMDRYGWPMVGVRPINWVNLLETTGRITTPSHKMTGDGERWWMMMREVDEFDSLPLHSLGLVSRGHGKV